MSESMKSGLVWGLLCHLERGCKGLVLHRVTWACGDLWQELYRQRCLEVGRILGWLKRAETQIPYLSTTQNREEVACDFL